MLDSFRNKVSNSMLQSSMDSAVRRHDIPTNQHEESKGKFRQAQKRESVSLGQRLIYCDVQTKYK